MNVEPRARMLGRLARIGVLVAVSTLAVAQYYLIGRYAVDIPNGDDFQVYLDFLNRWADAQSASEKLALLFAPMAQHYLLLSRVVALVCWKALGRLDFYALIVSGSLAVVTMFALLVRRLPGRGVWQHAALVPAALFLFHPQYVEATQWATTAWQFLWVNVFALVSLQWHGHPRRAVRGAAWLLALLATFSQGNGVLLFAAHAVMAALARRWWRVALWALSFAVLFGALYARLGPAHRQPIATPGAVVAYALGLLGSATAFGRPSLAIASGITVVASAAALAWAGLHRKRPWLIGWLFFLIGSAALNAMARAQLGVDRAYTTSRYTLVSLLCVIAIYRGVVELLNEARLGAAIGVAGALGVVLCAVSYASHAGGYRLRWELLRDSAVRWQVGRDGLPSVDPRAVLILKRSVELGIYRAREADLSRLAAPQESVEVPVETAALPFAIEHLMETPEWVLMDGWARLPDGRDPGALHVCFRNGPRFRCFRTEPRFRPDVTAALRSQGHAVSGDWCGFFALVPRGLLPPRRLEVSLIASDGRTSIRSLAGRSIAP